MLFAEKKDGGGLRLYVNYHSLNANIVTDAWPLLHIDNLTSQVKGARVFSSLEYGMAIIRYQSILLMDVKWLLHPTMSSMSIQLFLLGLRMHWLIFNIT